MSGFKNGANKMDQQRIKRLIADGVTAKDASETLKIRIECVESFYPKKKKTKAKE